MLTLFTTAKPFKGHIGIIQRNALQSWKQLDGDVEIIVFGDDEGSAQVSSDMNLQHEPNVQKNEFGTILVGPMFARAQALARHDLLCYVNCDIILMSDCRRAIIRTREAHKNFLLIGRRWDTDITEPIDFSAANWEAEIRARALSANRRRDQWWIDYFAFPRGLYAGTPALAIGRTAWDNWLVWQASTSGAAVVDASPSVIAVHQNHDYAHHKQGKVGVWTGGEASRNFALAGGWAHLRTIGDASHVLGAEGMRRNHLQGLASLRRHLRVFLWESERVLTYKIWLPAWHYVLGLTRPLRSALGLRSRVNR